jgi:hypothetical protein
MAHLTEAELLQKLQQAAEQVHIGARYRHYKDETHTYQVQGFAIIEATDEIGVVYKAEYGAGLTFVRSLVSWLDKVEWGGTDVHRFTLVEN